MTTSPTAQDTRTFRDLGVPKKLNEALHRNGMKQPFPIQIASLPATLDGRDLCGRAPTGSGKTLAFAIPLVENVTAAEPHHPRALVLVPTRELASQVRDTVLPLAQARNRWVATFYGGTNIRRDVDRLRRGVDIAIGTPGRIEDLVQRGDMHLDHVHVVVLDEADRMADMGFLPVVKRLLDRTASDRQTLLFSATLDGDVDVLVRRYQQDPVRVEVETPADEVGQVNHLFWGVDRAQRREVTADVLRNSGSTIVFARTKRGADRLAKQLRLDGLETAAIHGDRSQSQRERALKDFSEGRVTALIATDVAARGIHVDAVDTVLHYDLPQTDKDYVHRSGRTGRAGATGVVVSLVAEDQHGDLRTLQRGLDVGEGLHRMDLRDLAADEVDEPRADRLRLDGPSGGSQGKAKGGGAGNGQRSKPSRGQGNGNGNASRSTRNGGGRGRSGAATETASNGRGRSGTSSGGAKRSGGAGRAERVQVNADGTRRTSRNANGSRSRNGR